MSPETPWTLIRADDGGVSLIDKADPAGRANPVACQVKPTEAPLLVVAPQMRGVLSEMTDICKRMFAAMPSDTARRTLLERADRVLKASHDMALVPAPVKAIAASPLLMTDRDIEALAMSALDAACLLIQNRLGVKAGDFAGIFFSGEDPGRLQEYIHSELNNIKSGDYLADPAPETLMRLDGFDLIETGGNCTALVRVLPDGRHLVLTAAGGPSAYLAEGEGVLIGLYPNEQWDPDEGTVIDVASFEAAKGAVTAITAEPGSIVSVPHDEAAAGAQEAIAKGMAPAIGWRIDFSNNSAARAHSPRG